MTKRFNIGGMTCVNCQSRIENSLRALSGIKEVHVNYRTGDAQIEFDVKRISFSRIEQKIKNLGYEVQIKKQSDKNIFARRICFLTSIIILYIMLQQFGIMNLLVPSQLADSGMGYGMLIVIGLLTSVHCIAMCGGINLSQCLPVQEVEEGEKNRTTFLPAMFYNLGRVISYTTIGFLWGFIGWLFGGNADTGVPMFLQGSLKVLAGLLMVIMGINMLGIFPWLRCLVNDLAM